MSGACFRCVISGSKKRGAMRKEVETKPNHGAVGMLGTLISS
jgi:hypothetical protein